MRGGSRRNRCEESGIRRGDEITSTDPRFQIRIDARRFAREVKSKSASLIPWCFTVGTGTRIPASQTGQSGINDCILTKWNQ
eukprot:gene17506-biopygen5016